MPIHSWEQAYFTPKDQAEKQNIITNQPSQGSCSQLIQFVYNTGQGHGM
jgi:hypothetical protein